jgi:phytanoyl-CoA hydroxylase
VSDLGPLAGFFLRTGYARVPGLLPEPLVARIEATIDSLFAEPTAPYRVNRDDEVSRIDDLLDRDPVFLETLRSDAVLPALSALLGPDIEVLRFRHNHATLNRAGDQAPRLHRDVQQWSRPILNVFVYLEDADEETGATLIVPGSQDLPYYGPQSEGGGGTWADEHPELRHIIGQEVPIPMRRGGVLLMNPLTFHSVGENRTSRTRKSIVFACHSSDDLLPPEMGVHVQLAGERRFRGNNVQRISGGLELAKGRNDE